MIEMIWRNAINGILKASFFTIIVPAVFVSSVFKVLGFTVDSLLAVIFFGQFYIIWGQLEVAMRQTRLSTLEYEPEFKIEIKKSSEPVVSDDERFMEGFTYFPYDTTLKNGGKHLARNVSAEINILAFKHPYRNIKPIVKQFGDISADDKPHFVYGFMGEDLKNNRVTIKFKYQNILGESGSVSFVSEPEFCEFIGVERVKMPGVLLNSFEMLFSRTKRI
jgi:hypothetical protein